VYAHREDTANIRGYNFVRRPGRPALHSRYRVPMYERLKQPLLTRAQFATRVALHLLVAVGTAAIALFAGILGYHVLGRLPWIDSLLNASMILGGMGPVDTLQTSGAKLFASFYALFSGIVFIALQGVLLAPFIHRLMHRMHIDESGNGD